MNKKVIAAAIGLVAVVAVGVYASSGQGGLQGKLQLKSSPYFQSEAKPVPTPAPAPAPQPTPAPAGDTCPQGNDKTLIFDDSSSFVDFYNSIPNLDRNCNYSFEGMDGQGTNDTFICSADEITQELAGGQPYSVECRKNSNGNSMRFVLHNDNVIPRGKSGYLYSNGKVVSQNYFDTVRVYKTNSRYGISF